MFSEDDDVDIHALKRQGMTISRIARRTNHDRKTIRPIWCQRPWESARRRPTGNQ